MGLLDFLRGDKDLDDWDTVKTSKDVYPKNAFTILMVQTESGKPATGWVDLAYKDYPFKRNCSFNLQFTVEIDETDSNGNELDMGTVEDYFKDILQKGCIAHAVARVATDFGFIMDFYVDDATYASDTLAKLYDDPNKLVEFGCGFHKDPKWKEYKRITKLTE